MPGLMAIREEFAKSQPLKRRAHHRLAAHDDPDRGADRDAARPRRRGALGFVQHLLDAGSRCGRDRLHGTPVFAVKGESLTDYWDYTHRIFEWPDGGYTNMILDDGGDATLLLHLGAKAEKDASLLAKPGSEEEQFPVRGSIKAKLRVDPKWYSTRLSKIKGVTEETTTGVQAPLPDGQGRAADVSGDQRE
jgi:adenosylhomocysteinase